MTIPNDKFLGAYERADLDRIRRQRDDTIRSLHQEGWTYQQIVTELGVSKAGVSYAVNRTVRYSNRN